MARPASRYVCQACGVATLRWEGQCRACDAWNTLVETLVREPGSGRASAAHPRSEARPIALSEVGEEDLVRHAVGIGEFDRVLGGGLVRGSVVLLGGEPGIGKSTLVLEAAAGMGRRGRGRAGRSEPSAGVLYVSAEESAAQVRLRARRLGLLDGPDSDAVLVLAETEVGAIVEQARAVEPVLLVVDSIQSVTVEGLEGPAGSVGQVREAASALAAYARACGVPVLLVGHMTKEGSLAGPKALEHLVDAVLTLEGERAGALRVLRATKNRFGSTEEVGVFEMAEGGLRELPDPSRAFLGERSTPAPGVAVAAALEGSRPLLVEVQALVASAPYGSPRRTVSGLDPARLALLLAVLGRRAGLNLAGHDIYASLAGGLRIEEPALDLPLALALASSTRDRGLRPGTVAWGEVSLLGELRSVTGSERRLREAARLGFTRAIVPTSPARDGRSQDQFTLEIVSVSTLREALLAGLLPADDPAPAR